MKDLVWLMSLQPLIIVSGITCDKAHSMVKVGKERRASAISGQLTACTNRSRREGSHQSGSETILEPTWHWTSIPPTSSVCFLIWILSSWTFRKRNACHIRLCWKEQRDRARWDEMISWVFYPADFAVLGLAADDDGFAGFDRAREVTEGGELGNGVGVN